MSQVFEFEQLLKNRIREKQLQEESELEREKFRSLKTQSFLSHLALDIENLPAPKSPYLNQEIPKIVRTQLSPTEERHLQKMESFLKVSLGDAFSKQQLKKTLRRAVKSSHPDHRPGDAQASAKFTEIFSAYQALKKYF